MSNLKTRNFLATIVAGTATAILEKLSKVEISDVSAMNQQNDTPAQSNFQEEPQAQATLILVEEDEMNERKLIGRINVQFPISEGADGKDFVKTMIRVGEEAWKQHNESQAT